MKQNNKTASSGTNTQEKAALEQELNALNFDELCERMDTLLRQTLGEENMLSEAQANEQIDSLLAKTREPSDTPAPLKRKHAAHRSKRIALLAAALVLLAAALTLAVSANLRSIKLDKAQILNEDNRILHIRFEPEEDGELMYMEEYETALQEFGIPDYKIPFYFYEGERWRAEIKYSKKEPDVAWISAAFTQGDKAFEFIVTSFSSDDHSRDMKFPDVEQAETIQAGETPVYLFGYGKGKFLLLYFFNNCEFRVIANDTTLETMREVAQTVT